MASLRFLVRALLAILLFTSAAQAAKITRPVEDPANIFTTLDKEFIAKRLLKLRSDTDAQMAVLTVRSLGGQSIEAYSLRAAKNWGGGRKNRNDGLLLVIAPKDRRIRLEVGTGLAGKLTNDRVQRILDNAGPMLKMQSYKTAVLDITDDIDGVLRGRSTLLKAGAVAAGALVTGAGVRAATSSRPAASNAGVQPSSAGAPRSPAPAAVEPTIDSVTADSAMIRQFFLVLSIVCFALAAMYGRARLRQDPNMSGFISYLMIIVLALGVSWFLPNALGSGQLSPSILIVTLVQAISGMRAAMATHLQRVIGPDYDYELIERASVSEVIRYVLPGIVATLVLGLVLRLPAVNAEQFVAVIGTALIGVIHAVALNKLQDEINTRPLLPPGSFTRICMRPAQARTYDDGRHVHEIDDTTTTTTTTDTTTSYNTDNNDTDNRGNDGKFEGNGASSSW